MKSKTNIIYNRIICTVLLISYFLLPVKLIAKNVNLENVKKVALNVFSNRTGIDKSQIQIQCRLVSEYS
jgi:hypothetical protein